MNTTKIRVEWDTTTDDYPDGDPAGNDLPEYVEVPTSVVVSDFDPDCDDPVSEWLSDSYGWLVQGWREDGMNAEQIEAAIAPILRDTYGKGSMVDSLASSLASKIATFEPDYERGENGTREYMIMRECWDWMTGGTTAANVARKIEEAL